VGAMKRVLAIAVAACLVAGVADAKRRHGSRHKSHTVRNAIVVYVIFEDDCPKNPPEPTLCYYQRKGKAK